MNDALVDVAVMLKMAKRKGSPRKSSSERPLGLTGAALEAKVDALAFRYPANVH